MSKQYTPPEGTCIYAVGDIHGRLDLLARMHRLIMQDKAERKAERFVLVYLGDYVDRGAHSREVVEALIQAPLEGFEVVHLKGNHEHAMLQFVATHGQNPAWLFWGGLATLANYGVATRGISYEAMAASLAEKMPQQHRDWLEALPYYHIEGDYLFVHAGIRPRQPIEKQKPDDMMTIRDEFFNSSQVFEKTVVFGHTVFDAPLHLPDRIGIDTGAYATGVLTTLVLQGTERGFLQTGL